MSDLIPPDFDRCQVFITDAHSHFSLGPRPQPRQCENKPAYLLTELTPSSDGERGQMTACESCIEHLNRSDVEVASLVGLS